MKKVNADRDREMMSLKLDGSSYAEIGQTFNVSRQRVQQILAPPVAIRNIVVHKASGLCQGCGIKVGASGDIHHKDSNLDMLDNYNDMENLVLLCITCHRQAHWVNSTAVVRCKKCRSRKTTKYGFALRARGKIQQYRCLSCRHVFTRNSDGSSPSGK